MPRPEAAGRSGEDSSASDRPRFARIEQPRAHEYVAEQLRREIMLGLTQVGEKLPSERNLVQLFGVSRITVQQALVACRREVEPAAAAQAAGHRTEEDLSRLGDLLHRARATDDDLEFTNLDSQFHMSVAEASRNRFLRDVVERVRLAIADAILILPETPLWRGKSLREHQAILNAIGSQDADAARSAMGRHVDHTARSISALLETL